MIHRYSVLDFSCILSFLSAIYQEMFFLQACAVLIVVPSPLQDIPPKHMKVFRTFISREQAYLATKTDRQQYTAKKREHASIQFLGNSY